MTKIEAKMNVTPISNQNVGRKSEKSSFKDYFKKVEQDDMKINRTIRRLSHGGSSMDPAQLIGIQAAVYSYSQRVDLSVKTVNEGVKSIRSILQSQQ